MTYKGMTIKDVALLPGVSDIKPLLAKGKFAQALIAESDGRHDDAARLLDEAVAKLEP